MVYKSLPFRSKRFRCCCSLFFPIVNEGRRVISIKVFLSALMMFSCPTSAAHRKSVGVSQLCEKQQLN